MEGSFLKEKATYKLYNNVLICLYLLGNMFFHEWLYVHGSPWKSILHDITYEDDLCHKTPISLVKRSWTMLRTKIIVFPAECQLLERSFLFPKLTQDLQSSEIHAAHRWWSIVGDMTLVTHVTMVSRKDLSAINFYAKPVYGTRLPVICFQLLEASRCLYLEYRTLPKQQNCKAWKFER